MLVFVIYFLLYIYLSLIRHNFKLVLLSLSVITFMYCNLIVNPDIHRDFKYIYICTHRNIVEMPMGAGS